jgi:RNA polymerase sigma factor (sigma-70 family)
MNRNEWELDDASFTALMAALHPDRGEAGAVYEGLRRRLIRFFTLHGTASPEELADEAFNRLARKLAQGEEIRQASQYLVGVARILLHEERSRMQREQRALRQGVPADNPSEDDDIARATVESCLDLLSAPSRDLIRRYYGAEGRARIETRRKMAEEFGISLNALRNRALRIREELENCAKKRLDPYPKQDIRRKNLSNTQRPKFRT